jgi:hypothetical protein
MIIYSGTPGAGGTQINLPYMPQILVCDQLLTRLSVNALGLGVVTELTDASLIRLMGEEDMVTDAGAATLKTYSYFLGDGLFGGQNCQITIAQAAATILYGFSMKKGANMVQTIQQTVFANSGITFDNFLQLYLSSGANTDIVNVLFADDTSQQMTVTELLFLQRLTTNTSQSTLVTNVSCVIDNTKGQIKSLTYIPAAQRVVGVQKLVNVR